MIHDSYRAPVAIVQEIRKDLEYKLVAKERPRRGHLIFEFEFDTGILQVITPKAEDIQRVSRVGVSTELGTPVELSTKRIMVQRRPGCLYFSRLNYKSAFKYLASIMPGVSFERIP